MQFAFRFFTLLLICSTLLLNACKQDTGKTTAPPTEETGAFKTVPVPAFNRDSAFHFVEQQLAFGPRVPGSEGHRQTREWLVNKLRSYGAEVVEQSFTAKIYTGQSLPAVNIIAQFNPGVSKRVLLAAHWDTRFQADSPLSTERRNEPILGADDGGSGVAVLLEVARQLAANPIEMGVDIVFFDAEDQGQSGEKSDERSWGLGAQYWSKNPHKGGYKPRYGILVDMVGAEGARFPKEYHSRYFAGDLVDRVWKLAGDMGYGDYFLQAEGGGVTDDHYFVNLMAGIPMIDIINQNGNPQAGAGFGDHWHTHNDDIDIIQPRTLRAVGQVVLAVVYRENNGSF